MKLLKTQIPFYGEGWKDSPRLLVQIKRTGQVAIYGVFKAKDVEINPGLIRTVKPEAYEVIRIKQEPVREVFGRLVEAHEVYPSGKQFGPNGKFVQKLDRAEQIFSEWVKEETR